MRLAELRTRAARKRCADWHDAQLAARGYGFSQDDAVVANAAGATVRADINSNLQAIATKQSGTAAPGTTYAYEDFADTTNNVLKRRNAANSGYLIRDTLSETFLVARSSNTILGLSDYSKTFAATSTFTQTLTAAATLGDGWYCDYRNDGSGIITIDPNSSEQIDGATTMYLYPGEGCRIRCDGSGFKTTGRSTGWVKVNKQVASASATIDFTQGITSDFDEYVITINDMVLATDSQPFDLHVSEDAGSTWKSGGTDYAYQYNQGTDGAAVASIASTGAAAIVLAAAVSNAKAFGGEVHIHAPAGTSRHKLFKTHFSYEPSGSTVSVIDGTGAYIGTANAITGIRFLANSGNITAGTFTLYGIRK